MRKHIAVFLCIFSLHIAAFTQAHAAPAPPKIAAASAILVDAVTGDVLYEKACRKRRPPASTTKMMTAILALENGKLDQSVCASPYASRTPFGSLNLKPGEQLSLNDVMYAMLLRSANDGAVCIAENVAGSEKKFVELMNKKAKEIGTKQTHFANPHGLQNKYHYSTAYDLALIARYAVGIPEFNEMVRTKKIRIERSINTLDVTLKNTANFLWKFDGADGIKTGYTRQAGHCFVGSATRDGWRLIAVVLKSKSAGEDTAALMNYGFKYFQGVVFVRKNDVVVPKVPVAGGVVEHVDLVAAGNLAKTLPRSAQAVPKIETELDHVSAPIKKGEKLGTLTGYLNGEKIGTVDLVAAESIDRTVAATIWLLVRSVLTVSGIVLVGFVTYGTAVAKTARRRRRGFKKRS